jgi:hypothetical protein
MPRLRTLTLAAPLAALATSAALVPAARAAAQSPVRPAIGALLGGAVGVAAGGFAGAIVGGNRCSSEGNPDSCDLLGGLLAGTAIGYTLGTPVGAHLVNRRRGQLPWSLAASAGLAAAGYAVLRAKGVSFYGINTPSQRRLASTVVITVPILQFVATTAIETVTSKR